MAWTSCPACGKSIASNAATCPYCHLVRAEVSPAPARRWPAVVAGVVLVASLLAIVVAWVVVAIDPSRAQPRQTLQSDAAPARIEVPVPRPRLRRVEALDMAREYEANSIRADGEYKDRLIEVHGRVVDIGTEILGRPYLVLGDQFQGVQALFPKDAVSGLSSIAKGQTVTVRCRIDRKVIMHVLGNDCAIVP